MLSGGRRGRRSAGGAGAELQQQRGSVRDDWGRVSREKAASGGAGEQRRLGCTESAIFDDSGRRSEHSEQRGAGEHWAWKVNFRGRAVLGAR